MGNCAGLRYSHSASSRAFKTSLRPLPLPLPPLLLHSETLPGAFIFPQYRLELSIYKVVKKRKFSFRYNNLLFDFSQFSFSNELTIRSSSSFHPFQFSRNDFIVSSWKRLIGVFRFILPPWWIIEDRRTINRVTTSFFSFFFFLPEGPASRKIYGGEESLAPIPRSSSNQLVSTRDGRINFYQTRTTTLDNCFPLSIVREIKSTRITFSIGAYKKRRNFINRYRVPFFCLSPVFLRWRRGGIPGTIIRGITGRV